MSAKRALIVDDSRSARVILGRMLETHGLQVDTVESGEQALDYLRSAHPDVVFMDHLMPGMDGFEAVRAMRANAQTASIPVMMYTSQEGEGYLQEARRVGALGVLSKTLKPADVSRALYELNLLPDRRDLGAAQHGATQPNLALKMPSQSDIVQSDMAVASAGAGRMQQRPIFSPSSPHASQQLTSDISRPQFGAPKNSPRPAAPQSASPPSDFRASVLSIVEEQQRELHQLLQASIDAMSSRLSAELRATAQQASMSPPVDDGVESNSRGWFAAALILVALIPTGVIAALYWRTLNDNQAQLEQSTSRLAMVVTDQQTQIEQLRAELRKRQDAMGAMGVMGAMPPGPHSEVITVPYGELPLASVRVQHLQIMIDRLLAEGFRGKLVVSTFVGDFCFTGNAINGYALARDDVPIRRCDLIGNPYEDSLPATQRQSSEFVNLLASVGSKLRIEVRAEGRKPAVAYPSQNDKLAGEWNRVAARNHRVEFAAISADQK